MEENQLIEALDTYFSRSKKFIDTSRIPLICQDIYNIHRDIKDIKGQISWFVKAILGALIIGVIGIVIAKI